MVLDSIVKAARNHKGKTTVCSAEKNAERIQVREKTNIGIIDADQAAVEMQKKEDCRAWEECSHLKWQNSEGFCSYFISKCAKEKCNGKFLNQ